MLPEFRSGDLQRSQHTWKCFFGLTAVRARGAVVLGRAGKEAAPVGFLHQDRDLQSLFNH